MSRVLVTDHLTGGPRWAERKSCGAKGCPGAAETVALGVVGLSGQAAALLQVTLDK